MTMKGKDHKPPVIPTIVAEPDNSHTNQATVTIWIQKPVMLKKLPIHR